MELPEKSLVVTEVDEDFAWSYASLIEEHTTNLDLGAAEAWRRQGRDSCIDVQTISGYARLN